MPQVIFQDLGLIDYKSAWDLQEKLHAGIVAEKRSQNGDPAVAVETTNYLLFCEHPHVYTLGRSGDEKNLLVDDAALKTIDATFYKNNRGGDITYHGPGQIV